MRKKSAKKRILLTDPKFGSSLVTRFVNNLMLDLKLKDIPQTVYRAIKALKDIKFGFITIHGQGGMPMIKKASVEAVLEERSRGGQMAQAMGAVNQNS